MPTPDWSSQTYPGAVYAHVERWYEIADRKAQIVLVLDGAFLSFLTSQAFAEVADLRGILPCVGPETKVLLALMALSLAASILFAIACLHPRLREDKTVEAMLKEETGREDSNAPVPARLMWFFGYIAQLDQERVARQLLNADPAFGDEALAYEAAKFSRNVVEKHKWANLAFLFAGASLIFLLCATASYWWRVMATCCGCGS